MLKTSKTNLQITLSKVFSDMIHGFNLDALTCYEKNDGNKKPAE